MTKVKQIYIFVWPSRSRYTYCSTHRRVGILNKWLSKRRYTYLYDLRKSDVHTCMTQEEYVYMLVWIWNSKEEQGIHTCLTEEKQIYILSLVGLRKSKYLYLHDWGKAGIHTCITEKKQIHLQVWLRKSRHTYLYEWGKAGIHTLITEEKQVYICVWLRKSRYTYSYIIVWLRNMSCMWWFLVFLSLSHTVDCIDSWSLPSSILTLWVRLGKLV